MKHEVFIHSEGNCHEVLTCEAKLATGLLEVRGDIAKGDPIVVIASENREGVGEKFATRQVLRPISAAAARAFADRLLDAAREAENLYSNQRTDPRYLAAKRLAAAFACIHNRRGPTSITMAERVTRAVEHDTAPEIEVLMLVPLANEVLNSLGVVFPGEDE